MQVSPDLQPLIQPTPMLEDIAALRERWPRWLRDEFKAMGPAAVWIGGSRDLISGVTVHHADGSRTSFGHNRLMRPVKLGISEAWKDTVSNRLDQSAYWWQGLLVRIWVPSDGHARRLSAALVEALSLVALEGVELRKDFIPLDPDVSLERLGSELLATAQRLLVEAWDDDGLVDHLTRRWRAREEARNHSPLTTHHSRGRR